MWPIALKSVIGKVKKGMNKKGYMDKKTGIQNKKTEVDETILFYFD